MSTTNWVRKTISDLWGKPISLWTWKDAGLTISQNVAVYEDGELVRWDFEICKLAEGGEERYLGEATSLDAAKRKAKELAGQSEKS